MPTALSESLLNRVIAKLSEPASFREGASGSILTISAAQYGSKTFVDEDLTQPTGFDPQAAALFEAVVEAAYLVANADGDFDATEREAFLKVVLAACGGSVAEAQLSALLSDLSDQLGEDGVDKRVKMVGRTIVRADQALEVLRVAGLVAHVSHGISDVERTVIDKLAVEFGLSPEAVTRTLSEVSSALTE